jgi:hypothetical protein
MEALEQEGTGHIRSLYFACHESRSTEWMMMFYAIKADIRDPDAEIFFFNSQKTMFGGKKISVGDRIFIFANENKGGKGLIAFGIVTTATTVPKLRLSRNEISRVSISITRTLKVRKQLDRSILKPFNVWDDGQSATELNAKLYRQSTNKIASISPRAAAFLEDFF